MITLCRLGFRRQNKGDYPKSTTITLRLPSTLVMLHTGRHPLKKKLQTHIPHAKFLKQIWLIELGHESNEFEGMLHPVELQLGFRPV